MTAEDAPVVEQELPYLYQAGVSVFGAERAQAIFSGWSASEVEFVRSRTKFILPQTLLSSGAINHPDENFRRYAGTLAGVFGEVDGMMYLSRNLDKDANEIFVSEDAYRKLNRRSKLHDGLVLTVTQGRVIVKQILESKVGEAKYDRKQVLNDDPQQGALGYLVSWQRHGMVLELEPGRAVQFRPDEIFLRLATADGSADIVDRPIVEADGPEVEAATTLIGTGPNPGGFLGRYRQVTLNPRLEEVLSLPQIQQVIRQMIVELSRGKTIKTPLQSPVVRLPKPRVLDVEDYLRRLSIYVLRFHHMPKPDVGDDGPVLSRMLTQRGGRSHAFINDLSPSARATIVKVGTVPALHPLQSHLMRSNPYNTDGLVHEGVTMALLGYIFNYEGERADEFGLEEMSPNAGRYELAMMQTAIASSLKHANSIVDLLTNQGTFRHEWRRFFSEVSPQLAHRFRLGAPGACPGAFRIDD